MATRGTPYLPKSALQWLMHLRVDSMPLTYIQMFAQAIRQRFKVMAWLYGYTGIP